MCVYNIKLVLDLQTQSAVIVGVVGSSPASTFLSLISPIFSIRLRITSLAASHPIPYPPLPTLPLSLLCLAVQLYKVLCIHATFLLSDCPTHSVSQSVPLCSLISPSTPSSSPPPIPIPIPFWSGLCCHTFS